MFHLPVVLAVVIVLAAILAWPRPRARCVLIGLMKTIRDFADGRIRPEDLEGAIFLLDDFTGSLDQLKVESLLSTLVREGIAETDTAPAVTAILRAMVHAEHNGRVVTIHTGTTAFTYEDLNEILVRHHYRPLPHNRRMVGDMSILKQQLEDTNPDYLAVWM